MLRFARMSVILGAMACACGNDVPADTAGTATEATSGPTGPTAPTDGTTGSGPPTSSEPTGGTGGVTGSTSLDPTNAFTDSSQLTEGPSETGVTGEPPPPPHMCEASGICLDPGGCTECSLSSDCADELAACAASQPCKDYSTCINLCNDVMCAKNCNLLYPDGYDLSWALADCGLCTVCPNSCNIFEPYCSAGGGGVGKTETCDQVGECQGCTACSIIKGCFDEVNTCLADPECQPYQACINLCSDGDIPCLKFCEGTYPSGYAKTWAAFDCGVCTECPTSCASAQPYCALGGGGPTSIECLDNGACVELYDSQPYCVNAKCVECLTNDDCFDPAFVNCVDNFCK